jgi:hypothetical protein
MGGDYAQIVSVDAPVHTTDCLSNRWVIHAVAYRTLYTAPVAPSPAPPLPPGVPLAPDAPPAAATRTCDPPCSPGYTCSAGVCLALCNPTCGAGQVCRQDRTCGPAN